jgi:hypothetical protein
MNMAFGLRKRWKTMNATGEKVLNLIRVIGPFEV